MSNPKTKPRLLIMGHTSHIKLTKWAQFFQSAGWEVYYLTFQSIGIKGVKGVCFNLKNIKTAGNNYIYLLKFQAIRKYIKALDPDIINSHFLTSYGTIAWLSRPYRHIVNLYGTDVFINPKRSFILRSLAKRVLKGAAHIFSVSDSMTDKLTNEFNVISNKISTLQYGIDFNSFKCDTPHNEREYDFVTNRNFIENSNYFLILNSFISYLKRNRNSKLLIFGKGPLENEIKQLVKHRNLENNIKILEHISHDEVPAYLNRSKVFISVTNSDGTPSSVFEAIACGCYPLLSGINAYHEWANKGLHAVFADISSGALLSSELEKSLNNSIDKELNMKNAAIIEKHLNYKNNMRIAEARFRELL